MPHGPKRTVRLTVLLTVLLMTGACDAAQPAPPVTQSASGPTPSTSGPDAAAPSPDASLVVGRSRPICAT